MPCHHGLCTFDHNGNLIYADGRFDRIAPTETVVGKPLWTLADDPKSLRSKFSECALDGQVVTDETPITTPAGERLRIVHTYYPLPEDGEHRVACVWHEPMTGAPLTAQELDCLRLLADGLHQDEIAARLLVSESSVKTALHRCRVKLAARTITHAVALAGRCGVL